MEQVQTCKTCGASNTVNDQYCRVCQSLLEVELTNGGDDNSQLGQSATLTRPLDKPPEPKPDRRFPQSITTRLNMLPLWIKFVALAVIFSLVLSSILLYIFNQPKPVSSPLTTLCLATSLPLSGLGRAAGTQIHHGAELAYRLSYFGDNKTYKNHQLKIVHMDHSSPNTGQSDPKLAVENQQKLLQDAFCLNPIAIIGPNSSSVAVAEIPFAAQNGILLLSPANTAPCLTQEAFTDPETCDYASIHPKGLSNTYARLPSTDKDQAYQVARLLMNDPGQGGLKAENIVIVGDEETYGTQLSQAVIKELGQRLVKPVGVYCIKSSNDFSKNPSCSQLNSKDHLNAQAFSDDNIKALAVEIHGKHPDALFFGGSSSGGSLLRKELGSQVPFVGGDALIGGAQSFFDTIGSDAANVYATFPGTDPSTLTETTFFREYQKTFGTPPGPRSVDGYDATNIVLRAIDDLIDKRQPVTKGSVVEAVLNGRFVGVAGKRIQFDQYGDNSGERVFTIYQSQQQEGKWHWKRLREEVM